MPLRRKNHGQAQRSDQKENVQIHAQSTAIAIDDQALCDKITHGASAAPPPPLSPRLVRCQSDNTQRIVSGDQSFLHHGSLPKPSHRTFGSFSTKTKLANLTELNNSLVREISALRSSRSEAEQKLSDLNGVVRCLADEKTAMASSLLELQQSLHSLQSETEQKLHSLRASEDRLLSANADMEDLNTRLRDQISVLLSEKGSLLSEKRSAEEKKEDAENSLTECMIRERELHRSLNLVKAELSQATEKMEEMASRMEMVNADKQKMIQEHSARMEEVNLRYREMEERLGIMSKNTEFLKDQMEIEKAKLSEEVRHLRDGRESLNSEKNSILMKNRDLQDGLIASLDREEELKKSLSALKMKMEADLREFEASLKAMEEEAERASLQSSAMIASLEKDMKMKLCEEEERSDRLKLEVSEIRASIDSLSEDKQNLERCKITLEQKVMEMEQKLSDQILAEAASAEKLQKCIGIAEDEAKIIRLDRDKYKDLLKEEVSRSETVSRNYAMEKQKILDERDGDVSNLTLKLNELSEQLCASTKKIETLEDEKKSLLEAGDRLRTKQKIILLETEQLRSEKQSLMKQLEESKSQIELAGESFESLKCHKDAMAKKVGAMEALCSVLEEKKASLIKQVSEETRRRSVAEESNAVLKGQVENLRNLNAKLIEQLASLRRQMVCCEQKQKEDLVAITEMKLKEKRLVELLEEQKESSKHMEEMMAVMVGNAEERVRSLQLKLEAEANARALVEADLASMEALSADQKMKMEDSISSLTAKCQKVEREFVKLKEENEKLLHESDLQKDRASASLEALSAEKVKLEDCISNLTSNYQTLEAEIKCIKAENERLIRESVEKETQSAVGKEESLAFMDALTVEKMKLKCENDKLLKDCPELRTEISQLALEKERTLASMEVLSAENLKLIAQTEKRLHELAEEASQLSVEKQKASATIEDLNAEKMRLAAECEKLLNGCAELQQEVAQLAVEKERALASMEASSEETRKLITENQKLRRDSAENHTLSIKYQKVQEELEVERETQALAQSRFDSEINGLNEDNSKLITINNDLMSTIMILESKVKHLSLEDRKKEEQNSLLSKQIGDYTDAMNSSNAMLASKQAEIQGLMVERNEAFEKMAVREKELVESRGMNSVLQKKVELLLNEKIVLEERMVSEISDMKAKIAILEGEIADKASRFGEVELDAISLRKELESAALRASTVEAERDVMASEILEVNKKVEYLEDNIAEKMKRHDELELGFISLQNELKVLTSRASEVEAERAAMVSELSEANKKIVFLEDGIAEKIRSHGDLEVETISLRKQLELLTNQALRVETERHVTASDLSDAKAKIAFLEGEIAEKVRCHGELEFQVTSLQNGAKDLNDTKTEMLLEDAKMKTRALEEQLESMKTSLSEMQINAEKSEASVACLQTQLCSIMEEKRNNQNKNRKKKSSSPSDTNSSSSRSMEPKPEIMGKSAMDERPKVMRLALPVVLISAASSIMIAGLQSYLRRMEN